MDKVLTENLNYSFFKSDLSLENERERSDGKIIVTKKGSILLMDEWIRSKFKFQDDTGWMEVIKIFKKVRKLRQKPAHKLEEDEFNQDYFKNQRELTIEVYNALNFIRMLFQKHPKLKKGDISIPDWLENGKIYTY